MQILAFRDSEFGFDVKHSDGTVTQCNPWAELAAIRKAGTVTAATILHLAELGASCDAAHGRAVHDAKLADAEYRNWYGAKFAELRQPQESGEVYKTGASKGQPKTVQLSADDVKRGVEADAKFLTHKRAIARAEAQAASYAGLTRRINRTLAALQGVVDSGTAAAPYTPPSAPQEPAAPYHAAPDYDDGRLDYADGEDW